MSAAPHLSDGIRLTWSTPKQLFPSFRTRRRERERGTAAHDVERSLRMAAVEVAIGGIPAIRVARHSGQLRALRSLPRNRCC